MKWRTVIYTAASPPATLTMTATAVEICIDASQESSARSALTAAYMGGADRVEVCASMDVDGTTPPRQRIDSPAIFLSTALGSSA